MPVTGGAPVTLGTFAGCHSAPLGAEARSCSARTTAKCSASGRLPKTVEHRVRSCPSTAQKSVPFSLNCSTMASTWSFPSPRALRYSPTESGEGPIVVQAIGATDRTVLVPMGLHPRILPTGHLTYVHKGTLFAVAFDSSTRTVSGDPVPLVEDIQQSAASSVAQFAVSQNGLLIYGQGIPTPSSFQLVTVDRRQVSTGRCRCRRADTNSHACHRTSGGWR